MYEIYNVESVNCNFQRLVRMRSAVRICPAAPKTPDFFGNLVFFLFKSCVFWFSKTATSALGNTWEHERIFVGFASRGAAL